MSVEKLWAWKFIGSFVAMIFFFLIFVCFYYGMCTDASSKPINLNRPTLINADNFFILLSFWVAFSIHKTNHRQAGRQACQALADELSCVHEKYWFTANSTDLQMNEACYFDINANKSTKKTHLIYYYVKVKLLSMKFLELTNTRCSVKRKKMSDIVLSREQREREREMLIWIWSRFEADVFKIVWVRRAKNIWLCRAHGKSVNRRTIYLLPFIRIICVHARNKSDDKTLDVAC